MLNRIISTITSPFELKVAPTASCVDNGTREVYQPAVDLIIKCEKMYRVGKDGLVYPYYDAIGLPTIGVGHLLSPYATGNPKNPIYKGIDPEEVKRMMQEAVDKFPPISMDEAKALLNRDLDKFASGVTRLCKVPLHDYQFGALVSFSFNVGLGNLQASTLLRKLNRGDSLEEVGNEFLKWNKAAGIILKGLTARRGEERQMFLGQYGN